LAQETAFRFDLSQANEIDVDDLRQQPRKRALMDADRQQNTFLARRIARKSACPLRVRIGGVHVAGRQHRDRPLRLLRGAVHLDDEVTAGLKVPGLKDGLQPAFLELPSDPFSPGEVRLGVADKKIHRLPPLDSADDSE
jgi:hypothetical protein